MSGLEIRVSADIDQTAFGIKDPMGGAGVLRQKARERGRVTALRGRMLHVSLIERVVQCVDGNGMFQCSTPLTDDGRRTGAVPVSPLIFRFQQESEKGGRIFSGLGRNFLAGDAKCDSGGGRKRRMLLQHVRAASFSWRPVRESRNRPGSRPARSDNICRRPGASRHCGCA